MESFHPQEGQEGQEGKDLKASIVDINELILAVNEQAKFIESAFNDVADPEKKVTAEIKLSSTKAKLAEKQA